MDLLLVKRGRERRLPEPFAILGCLRIPDFPHFQFLLTTAYNVNYTDNLVYVVFIPIMTAETLEGRLYEGYWLR